MILAIDIGNTVTHLAVYDTDKIVFIRKFPTISHLKNNVLKSISDKFKKKIIDVGISSVVTEVNKQWERLVKVHFGLKPIFVNYKANLPIILKIKSRNRLGADRICNAVAGYEYFRKKENIIAVDFGTAVTYDITLRNGIYLGGIISPGIKTMAKSLNAFTSKLPMLKNKDIVMPNSIIGKNTVDAIKSGTLYASLASFEGIVKKIEEELNSSFKIILTGGFARKIQNSTRLKTIVKDNLVLDGINHILKYNYGA